MQTVRQTIERLEGWYPSLFVEPRVVAAVAVLSEYSASPASFAVHGEHVPELAELSGEVRLDLSWTRSMEAKAERLRATMQRSSLVELAATAVALVVARRFLDLGRLEVTGYGDRADFRSTRRRAVLEVSGTELADEFLRRHREEEERIAPRLDALGRNREAALHRISAATCHRNAGQFSLAANLFQGALAGPLNDATRADVKQFLEECLAELETSTAARSAVAM